MYPGSILDPYALYLISSFSLTTYRASCLPNSFLSPDYAAHFLMYCLSLTIILKTNFFFLILGLLPLNYTLLRHTAEYSHGQIKSQFFYRVILNPE